MYVFLKKINLNIYYCRRGNLIKIVKYMICKLEVLMLYGGDLMMWCNIELWYVSKKLFI